MSFSVHDISVMRKGKALLSGVSVGIEPGRFTAICGPNGAGKTTLLSVLTGAIAPTRGEVLLEGAALASLAPVELARRRAVLPQTPVLSFPFQVEEVVRIGRSPHLGLTTPKQDARIVEEAMRVVGISALRRRNYLTLSGGERQRVQLARTLAQVWERPPCGQSRWLLLDEPISALDLKHQINVMGVLTDLAEGGWGIIAVLHDLHLVSQYCDEVALLSKGRLVHRSAPLEALTPARIQSTFELESPFELRTGLVQAPAPRRAVGS